MEQCVVKRLQGRDKSGAEVWSFRIPNSTNDFIELSTYGCSLLGLYVHDRDGRLQNLVRGIGELAEYEGAGRSCASLLGGSPLAECLARKNWTVAEEGDNFVFLTAACTPEESGLDGGVKVGARVMWVNLNRLVVDLYLTPERGLDFRWGGQLTLREGAYQIRSFCPQVAPDGGDPVPVEETQYAEQQFAPLCGAVFCRPDEEIKPLAEVAEPATGMHLSVYGTSTCLRAAEGKVLQWCQGRLEAGESLASRLIYGVDYLSPQPETEGEPNPFAAFGFGLT